MNQLSPRKQSFTAKVAAALAGVGLAVGAVSSAYAEDIPSQGSVGQQAGRAAFANIADLKAPLDPSDYDDDPAGEPGSEYFHVAPNLGDAPMQMATKYVVVWNPSDVAELQVTIRTRPTGTVVLDRLLAGSEGLTGADCNALLGEGGVAAGLVATGQKSEAEILEIRNRCTQRTAAIWTTDFEVSKHLPPGWYDQCVAISHIGGGSSPRVCVPIKVVGVTGYQTDVSQAGLDFGSLRQGVTSIVEGDFDISGGGGTIMGTGNTSPVLSVAYSWMKNNEFDPGAPKYIRNDFDVQINRRDDSGLIVDYQYIDGLLGGADPDSAEPFAGAEVATLSAICLEPNEPLKLDFSVTPQQVLYDGTYHGIVRLTVGELEDGDGESGCTPTLGSGEHAGGDSNGVFNNLPGEEVEQELSSGPSPAPNPPAEEPTEEPTEVPTEEPTEVPTAEPTEEPTEAP